MESIADKSLFYLDGTMDDSAPEIDPREAKYRLAERLVDNIRFGEAIRILETLGDYGNSRALLAQVREWKSYSDVEEDRLKAERKQKAEQRARQEERDKKRRRVFYAALTVGVLILFMLIR